MAVEGHTTRREDTSLVSQTEHHHTAASLFNILYGYLREDGQIQDVRQPSDLAEVRAGQLVEIVAEYLGNPLENILAFFNALFPYIAPDEPATQQGSTRSGNPARRAAAKAIAPPLIENSGDTDGIKIIKMMARDLETAPVHDLLFRTDGQLEAVLTVASEFYTATINENLREACFGSWEK